MGHIKLLIVPIGRIRGPWLDRLLHDLAHGLAMEIQLSRPLPYPPHAFSPTRKKFFSHAMVELLRNVAGNVDFVLGLTDAELYSVQANSTFSEVHLSSRSAIIGLGPFRDFLVGDRPEELMRERIYKEVLYTLGKMLGLSTCINPHCVMYPSRGLLELDLKQPRFCLECRFKLYLRLGNIPLLKEAA